MSVVLRYVKTPANEAVTVCESFLGFIHVEEKTGEFLFETVVKYLEDCGLDLKNMRGQAYDNGSNMVGRISGVQSRILERFLMATFVACANHSCNLVLNDAAKTSSQTITFFGIIQELYVFASGSTNRWEYFKKNLKHFTLKPLSTTRWESRVESLKPLRFQISSVRNALEEIGSSNKFDADTRFKAKNLVGQIENFEFLVLLSAWYDILQHINILSKLAQENTIDVSKTLDLIEKTENYLIQYKTTGFESAKKAAEDLAEELGMEEEEVKFKEKRHRRRNRHFDDDEQTSSRNAVPQTAEELFRTSCFDKFLDEIMRSMKSRFTKMRENLSDFKILFDGKLLSAMNENDLRQSCMTL